MMKDLYSPSGGDVHEPKLLESNSPATVVLIRLNQCLNKEFYNIKVLAEVC